jgi:hypothetical protein
MTPEHERVRKIALEILTSAEARLKRMGASARPPSMMRPSGPFRSARPDDEGEITDQAVNFFEQLAMMASFDPDVQDCQLAIGYATRILQTVTDDNAAVILDAFRMGQAADRVALLRPIAREKEKEKGYRRAGAAETNLRRRIPDDVKKFIRVQYAIQHVEHPELNRTAISEKIEELISKKFRREISARTIRDYFAPSPQNAERVKNL